MSADNPNVQMSPRGFIVGVIAAERAEKSPTMLNVKALIGDLQHPETQNFANQASRFLDLMEERARKTGVRLFDKVNGKLEEQPYMVVAHHVNTGLREVMLLLNPNVRGRPKLMVDEKLQKKFLKHRRKAVASGDMKKIRRFITEWRLPVPTEVSVELFRIVMHKATTSIPEIKKKQRQESAKWLTDHGYEPLDDGEFCQ